MKKEDHSFYMNDPLRSIPNLRQCAYVLVLGRMLN